MIVSMEKRSPAPRSHRRTPRRGPAFGIKLLLRLLGLLLVAAIVVGVGTTANKGWDPDFRGEGPQISAEEKSSRNMLALAGTASELATGAGTTHDDGAFASGSPASASPPAQTSAVDARSAKELERAARLLRGHVELLTPGLAARVAQEAAVETHPAASSGTASETSLAADATSGAAALADVAMELADSANSLLESALTTDPGKTAAVLGSGIEQRLEAQRLAALVPGDTTLKGLPEVNVPVATEAWKTATDNQLPAGSCAADDTTRQAPSSRSGGTAASPKATDEVEAGQQAAAQAVREASDVAFRLAYGYQMAAVKHPGDSTRRGWDLATTASDLGHRLEDLLPTDCPPTRQAAYALPPDFNSKPLISVATTEGQLAALLRDAATHTPDALRPALIVEAWLSANRSMGLTGSMPDLT